MRNKDFNRLKRVRRDYLASLRLIKQWNQRLSDEGLSVESGKSSRLIYAGDTADLEIISKYGGREKD
jgi:hypothetical protein